jgi:hypothetical protein
MFFCFFLLTIGLNLFWHIFFFQNPPSFKIFYLLDQNNLQKETLTFSISRYFFERKNYVTGTGTCCVKNVFFRK